MKQREQTSCSSSLYFHYLRQWMSQPKCQWMSVGMVLGNWNQSAYLCTIYKAATNEFEGVLGDMFDLSMFYVTVIWAALTGAQWNWAQWVCCTITFVPRYTVKQCCDVARKKLLQFLSTFHVRVCSYLIIFGILRFFWWWLAQWRTQTKICSGQRNSNDAYDTVALWFHTSITRS